MLIQTLLGCGLILSATAACAEGNTGLVVLAQAGSTGGAIGKSGKSVSGQSDNQPATAPAAPQRKRVRSSEPKTDDSSSSRSTCAALTSHKWSSWAAGMFGDGDTVFQAGGTAVHNSGITGQWSCASGKIQLKWPGETFRGMHFSKDGKTLLGDESNQTRFKRGD